MSPLMKNDVLPLLDTMRKANKCPQSLQNERCRIISNFTSHFRGYYPGGLVIMNNLRRARWLETGASFNESTYNTQASAVTKL